MKERDAQSLKWLRENFAALGLSFDASEWLCDLFFVIQAFDDIVDGEKVERADLSRLIFTTLAGMPGNPFFAAHAHELLPVMANAVLKWEASDAAEQARQADSRSFVWRASYYDVILHAVLCAHGPQKAAELAPVVMALYGEQFEEYKKEFQHA